MSVILNWIVITAVSGGAGAIINAVLGENAKILQLLSVLEVLALGAAAFSQGISIQNIVIMFFAILMCIQYVNKIGKITRVYMKFAAIKEALYFASTGMFGYGVLSIFLILPELEYSLPMDINHFERYLYFDIVLYIILVIWVMQKEVQFPQTVLNWINANDIITQNMIDEFVNRLAEDGDASDDLEEKMYNTLADFVKIGILEMDEEERCFRKKK